jgi:DNA-binding NarL/FixJ family response regulator
VVAEIDANRPVTDHVDIVLYDSFAQPEADHDEIRVLVDNPHARRVVVYTWNFHPDLIKSAIRKGASGYLSKTLPARDLVTALEAIHTGDTVISPPPGKGPTVARARLARPVRRPHRSRVILALITQGKSNAEWPQRPS